MFELATTLGLPICELDDHLTTEELAGWRIWLSEPRGDQRADYHAAQICASVDRVIHSFAGKPFAGRLDPYKLRFQKMTPEEVMARNLSVLNTVFPGVLPPEILSNESRDADSESGT